MECDFIIGKCEIEDDLEILESSILDVHVSMDSEYMKDCVSIWASNDENVFISMKLNNDKVQKLIKALEACVSFFELKKALKDVE